MLNGRKVIVVMPAYNAAKTLEQTYSEIPLDIVDEVLVVDDGSQDETVGVARKLGLTTFRHNNNMGYGKNQKTCYREALRRGADIVIMVHPDYQYSPKLIASMAGMIAYGVYDSVIASRILGVGALKGGMPLYKYVFNRLLTAAQNFIVNYKLSEYHTGYRAFTKEILETLPLEENTNDFAFDNEMLTQVIFFGFRVGEISCPTKYFDEASSISFRRSVKYGFGVLATCFKFRLHKMGVAKSKLFNAAGGTLLSDYYSQISDEGGEGRRQEEEAARPAQVDLNDSLRAMRPTGT